MGNFVDLFAAEDFKYAVAKIENGRILLKWNRLQGIRQYDVETWCNGECKGNESVAGNSYNTEAKPGRCYHFVIKPCVVDGRESQEQRQVKSNTLCTIPSRVTKVVIKESNGIQITWREQIGECVRYFMALKHKGNLIDEVKGTEAPQYIRSYEELKPGEMYNFEVWAENGSWRKCLPTVSGFKYDGTLTISCYLFLKGDNLYVIHFVGEEKSQQLVKDLAGHGYKKMNQFGTYYYPKAESVVNTMIHCKGVAGFTAPETNSIRHATLWHQGFCIEEYLLKEKKRPDYTAVYIVRCNGEELIKIPFKWICRGKPRSEIARNKRPMPVPHNFKPFSSDTEYSTEEDSGRGTGTEDRNKAPHLPRAASDTSSPPSNDLHTSPQMPPAGPNVTNTYMKINNNGHVNVEKTLATVGGYHQTTVPFPRSVNIAEKSTKLSEVTGEEAGEAVPHSHASSEATCQMTVKTVSEIGGHHPAEFSKLQNEVKGQEETSNPVFGEEDESQHLLDHQTPPPISTSVRASGNTEQNETPPESTKQQQQQQNEDIYGPQMPMEIFEIIKRLLEKIHKA